MISTDTNATAPANLARVVRRQKRGQPDAVYAACTANAYAIRAVLAQAAKDGSDVLVESTTSQVNIAGGYSGLTPSDFRRRVFRLAAETGLAPDRVVLGGDHVGPYVWRHEGGRRAMQHAEKLVAACVAAGYRKLHLDTVTPCSDDPRQPDGSLDLALICRRTAELCRVAEQTAERMTVPAPWYVIGSDVPVPGGQGTANRQSPVTGVERLDAFLSHGRQAFNDLGLTDAWRRVFAVVVHSGADYSPLEVHPYQSDRMQPVVAHIRRYPRLVLEAHSTDYQSPACLTAMVADHFGVLKVGPALTFAMREAFFALADMEKEMLKGRRHVHPSGLPEIMDALMVADPRHWQGHYRGRAAEIARLRRSAYSDRIRYYWAFPEARSAVGKLMANLRQFPPPLSLVRAHLPVTAEKILSGAIANDPEAIVLARIGRVTEIYSRACSSSGADGSR